MNRRSLLALMGGAVTVPSIGVKAAASALGVETALLSGALDGPEPGAYATGLNSNGWWGSPLQMALDARESTNHDMANGNAYPHMKSWGRGFRTSVVELDNLILMMYRQKMREDADFRERVLAAFGV
jgi:hypothetical protein